MVVLDTSFVIAALSVEDPFHLESVETLVRLESQGEIFVINNFVVAELLTLANLRFKSYKASIVKYTTDLFENNLHNSIYKFIDEGLFTKSFVLSKESKISFTDCTVILTALQYKSATLLSHDVQLTKMYSNLTLGKAKLSGYLLNDKSTKQYSANKRKKFS